MANKRTRLGESKTRLYRTWYGVKARCTNPRKSDYKWYGGMDRHNGYANVIAKTIKLLGVKI